MHTMVSGALFGLLLSILLAYAGGQPPTYTPLPQGSIRSRGASSPLSEASRQAALPPTQAAGAGLPAAPASPAPATASNLCLQQASGGGPWGLSASGAATSGLRTSTERVLLCIISSGVAASNQYLKHNSWAGCASQDPLDPGGCVLQWDSPADASSNWKPRGTYAASIIAAAGGIDPRIRGIIPDRADIYVVPVNPDSGALDPGSSASGGRSRIRAYSACEGRLRGLQAQDYGVYAAPLRWRMVLLVDVATPGPTTPVGSADFQVGEGDWIATATGKTADGKPPDVLVVAPAGDTTPSVAFPAAFSRVVAVGGYACDGKAMKAYGKAASGKAQPDILAPGKNVLVPDVAKTGTTGVRTWEGSAAAAAYVAGAAARLWSAYPGCSADAIKAALLSSGQVGSAPAKLNLQQARTYLEQNKC